ncbi:MAG: DNA polymerase IV [Acidimicrobiales bacterium]
MTEPQRGPGSAALRTIFHVDMDAFYASVEIRRRPELAGRPVIVGGDGRRGVVAAASYQARVYGIHSAMSSARARRLCPHAVFLPGDHAHYAAVSREVMAVFASLTPLVEPLSLDEAFLDVSGSAAARDDPVAHAKQLRQAVRDAVQLDCSVGVASNKFLAKLASEAAKPRIGPDGPVAGPGVVVVRPHEAQAFLDPLPVRAIWGVGPAAGARLERIGVATVAELRRIGVDALVATLGTAHGRHLHELAHGRDDRPVVADAQPKSVSHEETFPVDVYDPERLRTEVVRMADGVGSRLRAGDRRGRTVQLKIRFGDFRTITRSVTLPRATDSGTVIARAARELLAGIDPAPGVRLLGVGVSGFASDTDGEQLSLDALLEVDPTHLRDDRDWREAEDAIDIIRSRFGDAAIAPASALSRKGLRPKRRGDQQWGPASP